MNNRERESIAHEVERLIERLERREIRQAKAAEQGDIEKVRLCERNDAKDLARLEGIDIVLGHLGYRRKWDNDRCVISKVG